MLRVPSISLRGKKGPLEMQSGTAIDSLLYTLSAPESHLPAVFPATLSTLKIPPAGSTRYFAW
jgi:hypothetical protein